MHQIGGLRKIFHVYLMASKPRGVFYVGMTSDLRARVQQHREGLIPGFTERYHVKRLVYFEEQPSFEEAATRERALKRWRRDWKIALIETSNPQWHDLFGEL